MLQRSRQYTPLGDRVRTGLGDAPEGAVVSTCMQGMHPRAHCCYVATPVRPMARFVECAPSWCTRGLHCCCGLASRDWRCGEHSHSRTSHCVVWPLETVSDCVPCVEAGAPRQQRPNESNARQSLGEVLRFHRRAASRRSAGA